MQGTARGIAEMRGRYAALIDAQLRHDRPDLARSTAALAVEQGLWADPARRPTEFLPRIGGGPIFPPSRFWFVPLLEAAYPAIRAEVDAVGDPSASGGRSVEEPLVGQGRWDQVVLYEGGRRQHDACSRFPVTASVVERIPEATTFGPGVVTLSWLAPGTHVVAHCGSSNTKLRVHLGLRVPDGPELRVADQRLTWQEGRCLVFDDSYEHEVWHRGDRPRLVLLVDVLHPDLDEAERSQVLARRPTGTEQIAGYLTEHRIRRVETDRAGVVMRPDDGVSALVHRYLAETGASAVELRDGELHIESGAS